MNAFRFYQITQEQLDEQARAHGVQNISRYYSLTDFHEGSFLNQLQDKAQVFAQIAFHAQNATMISSIVKFETNIEFLKETLCQFDPDRFLHTFSVGTRDESVKRITEALRYNETSGAGLKWNSGKSKEENKDRIIKRYANTLLDAAAFVNEFNSRAEFLAELLLHYPDADYEQVISFFRSKIPHGFSIALTCDFLKEFDTHFSDLPKPDIHIKDTLCALLGLDDGYYNNPKRELDCIKKMREIVCEINSQMDPEEQVTVYQVDRMIWLICSGNFYLDVADNYKETYLRVLREEDR